MSFFKLKKKEIRNFLIYFFYFDWTRESFSPLSSDMVWDDGVGIYLTGKILGVILPLLVSYWSILTS